MRGRSFQLVFFLVPLLVLAARGQEAALDRFVSAPLPSSGEGARFSIVLPPGWEVVLRGERTRAIPRGAPSRRAPPVHLDVLAIARDEPGSESLLESEAGLEKWLGAVYRRLRIVSRERVRIAGAERQVLHLAETPGPAEPPRRAILAHVPAADVHFVILAFAPEEQFEELAPVFRRSIASFEVKP